MGLRDSIRSRVPLVVNRLLAICVGCFAFGSWNNWYKVATGYGMLDSLSKVIGFTIGVVCLLAIVIAWYLPKREKVVKQAGVLLTQQATHHAGRKEILAAMLEKGFINLTDAMGYVIAEAWLTQLNPDPQLAVLAVIVVTLGASAIIFCVEMYANRFPAASLRHNGFDMMAQVLVGACAWFVSDPMVVATKRIFRVSKDPPRHVMLLIFLASTTISVLFLYLINKVQSAKCKSVTADDSDSDEGVVPKALFCENTVSMLKTAMFFTSARLLKYYVSSWEDERSPLGLFVWFTIAAAIVTVLMEQLVLQFLPRPPVSVPTLIVAYAQMNEVVSLSLRSLAWVSTKLFVAWGAAVLGKRKTWVFAILAIVDQFFALMLEHLRIKLFMQEVREQVENNDDASSDDDYSEDEATPVLRE